MSRVLLVDDDVELASMLREYIEQEGFEADVVHDGEAGVAGALSGLYAIVVLDVMMPRVGGIEALRRIRAQSQVPVLMLTAKGDDVDRIVGLELGADDYVPKPCTPRELVARLRAILRRTQEAAQVLPSGPLTVGQLVMWPPDATGAVVRGGPGIDQHRVQSARDAGSQCGACGEQGGAFRTRARPSAGPIRSEYRRPSVEHPPQARLARGRALVDRDRSRAWLSAGTGMRARG